MIKQIQISIILAVLLRLSLADTLNQSSVTSKCPCNQVAGVKEYQCCCDTDTTPDITPDVCIENNYGNVFDIPFYSDLQSRTSSIEDLYNPFRLVYQVIKTLGSVMDRNSVQSSISFQLPSPSQTKDFTLILQDQFKQLMYLALPSYLQPEQRVINKFINATSTDFGTVITTPNALKINMFVTDEVTGNCLPYVATAYETVKYQSCQIRDVTNSLYSRLIAITPTANDLCYDLSIIYELTSLTPTACATSASSVVGFIYSNIITNGIVYIRYPQANSQVFLGAKVFYDYTLRTTITPKPAIKPKSGYILGEQLIFNNNGNVQKGLPFNDIFDYRGYCYQPTDTKYNMQYPIDLQFGRNLTISCFGQNWKTNSFLATFSKIGKFSYADPNSLFDWITPSGQIALTSTDSFAIQIYYFKQGKKTNATYRITNVKFVQIKQDATNPSVQNYKVASILFYQQPQSDNFYLAAPPQLTAKLPRNILYPFFTFND
ncbi:hypothetical protein ABPG72_019643 [Tetrahymena utriculariae]